MYFNLKTMLIQILILTSANAFSATELNCKVSEIVNPPLELRSVNYNLNVPLTNADSGARIDLVSKTLKLNFSIITFKSKLTSPGEQVVMVTTVNTATEASSTADGHGSVQSFSDVENGTLIVNCSVI